MSVISQYIYPISDKLTVEWYGIPDNTNKWNNIKEGVITPNDADLITKSGLLSQVNLRSSFQFNTGNLHVLPSSALLNMRINCSGSDILDTGTVFLERALLLDSNSGVICSYEYKVAGEPVYSWGLSSDYNTNAIVLSGFTTDSKYFSNTSCDIRLSGVFTANSPTTDNFKLNVSAFEFVVSGTTGVEMSGIPLFISGPRPVGECFGPASFVGGSGDSRDNFTGLASGYWWNLVAMLPGENFPPEGISAINSGVHNPVDTSFTYYYFEHITDVETGQGPMGSDGDYYSSPILKFNAPTMNNIDNVTACFRARHRIASYDPNFNHKYSVRDVHLTNGNGTTIARWNNYGDPFNEFIIHSGELTNYCMSGVPTSLSAFTATNNSLTFSVSYASGLNPIVDFSEIEICVTGLDPVHSSFIPLYINGVGAANSGLDLYVAGHETSNSGIDLYISGPYPDNSGLSLYVLGHSIDNSGLPLYVAGHESSNSGIPLYIDGVFTANSGIPLFIKGPIPHDASMPLFVKQDPIPNIAKGMSLFTYSTTNSGLFNTFPLFVAGTGDLNTSMPLYLKGPDHSDISASMPLFLKTIGNLDGSLTVDSGIPLYLHNAWVSENSGIPLYISVQSGTEGAVPLNASMPLFIARDSEGYASMIPLYLKVADTTNSGLPLYTFGAYLENSGLSLVIPNVTDSETNSINLFTHGF